MTESEPNHNPEDYAAQILVEDRVLDALKALDIVSRCKKPHQVAFILMDFLIVHCNQQQLPQVSYLLDEATVLPPALEGPLRIKEHERYERLGNVAGVAKCVRRLAMLD